MIALAVVAIVKNEARYLEEWLEFHRLVGAGHFFVYDNGSTDGTDALLLAQDDVTSFNWPGERQQLPAYEDALSRFGQQSAWTAFLDADEFLYSPTFLPVPTILERHFAARAAVGACWAMYGTSGLQSPAKSVVAQFCRRARFSCPVHRHVKSIIGPGASPSIANDPHSFDVRTVDEHGRRLSGPFAQSPSWDLLRINHYWSKSIPEARAKAEAPRADTGEPRSLEVLLSEELNEVQDTEIHAYLPLLEARLAHHART